MTAAERNQLRQAQAHAVGSCDGESGRCEICDAEIAEDMDISSDLINIELSKIRNKENG